MSNRATINLDSDTIIANARALGPVIEEAAHAIARDRRLPGLLPEEYDSVQRRFLGNFPQAFSHVALINSARNLTDGDRPCEDRPSRRR